MTTERKANRGPAAAADNRRAILAAAREVFSADGLDAPLNRVAKTAGVGQGSLYRHFPDRVTLAVAVFDDNLDAIEQQVFAGASLDAMLDALIDQAVSGALILEFVTRHADAPAVRPLGDRLRVLVTAVTERAHADGSLRHDLTVDDVLVAITMLVGVLPRLEITDPSARDEQLRRARALIRSALSSQPGPTPGD